MIKIIIKQDNISDGLARLIAGLQQRQPMMQEIAETMVKGVQENFEQGGRPAWAGLKYREGKPLIDTATLKNSIASEHDNDHARAVTSEPYAAIHNFGGKAGRNRAVTIPKREFMRLTADDEANIFENVQDYLQRLLD